LVIFGWGGGEVPHSAYRMNFLNKEASIFGSPACGTWTRASQNPGSNFGVRDQVDARISPPADEYYIMKYEDAGPSMAVDIRDQR
jgi:hypothetical protein